MRISLTAFLALMTTSAVWAAPEARLAELGARYVGDVARSSEGLKPYTGAAAWHAIVGADRQKAYRLNYEQLRINYGATVDFQLRGEQVLLAPQTADFLYSTFTPLTVRYAKGTRPALERVAEQATAGCRSNREKALALMRYCRDLYKEEWYGEGFKNYTYGGTEEQLIEKGEILCECLGRLMVALCEVCQIPARIVMHDIGGHICAEVYVDGQWAYIDPRCGVYFLRADGQIASAWDLWQDPSIIRAQTDAVKRECSRRFVWEERAWKCEAKYFAADEIIGFENYSLADAPRFNYSQKSYAQAEADGLFTINKEYVAMANAVFGLEGDGFRRTWQTQALRKIPIAYRHDGFSIFYKQPPMTRQTIEERYVDPFANTNATSLVWGLGPGSVFCYATKVGEVFGQGLTPHEFAMLREGDRWVNQNVMGLIAAGADPLRVAIDRAHQLGLKLYARLEMNHEYGPADDTNWMWVAFVGRLNKAHPEYRIPGKVLLDFKHQAVRDFKLAIFREALEAGADGIEMDFAVYPPFFENPEQGLSIMTQFARDVRRLADEFSARDGKRVALMARVPARNAIELGLDWQTWAKEGLVDILVPTHYRPNETFDVNVQDFVSLGHRTGVQIYPTLWQALGFVTTDQQPQDDKTGHRRYDKPKTKEMYFAQALMFHRAGVDGIELGFSEDQWRTMPWLNDLADPEKCEFANKHYMVDVFPHCPVAFELPAVAPFACEKAVPLRIGDDIAKAKKQGYVVNATLVLYAAPLPTGARLAITVNGHGPVAAQPSEGAGAPITAGQADATEAIFDEEWWRRGEIRIPIEADWLELGSNEIRFTYTAQSSEASLPRAITWIDLLVDYTR